VRFCANATYLSAAGVMGFAQVLPRYMPWRHSMRVRFCWRFVRAFCVVGKRTVWVAVFVSKVCSSDVARAHKAQRLGANVAHETSIAVVCDVEGVYKASCTQIDGL
jgi:hypothetical protein